MAASDVAELLQSFARLSADARYQRFMQHKKDLDRVTLERGVRPVAGEEFAYVATVPAADGFDIVGAALEARRSAARAASEAGLKMREATLTINVGFALTTVGAKAEARVAIEGGIALAQAIGSPGTVRHGQMNLLGWVATFGGDHLLDRMLADPRSVADSAAAGSWVPHDRATLGVLYYRGLELLRSTDGECAERARALRPSRSGPRGRSRWRGRRRSP